MAAAAGQDAAKALATFRHVSGIDGEQKAGEGRLTQSVLQQCSGLCFTFVKRGGAVLTVEGGHGFVISKKGDSWSAPLFIDVSGGGLGLSLGYSEIDSVIVLENPTAVQRYAGSQADFAGGVAAVGPGGKVGVSETVSVLVASEHTSTYSVSSGALVDLSWQGLSYDLADDKNKELYGRVKPAAILESDGVPAFAELYAALNSFIATGTLP